MDFTKFLVTSAIDFFKSFKRPETDAIADLLIRWGVDFSFNRTSNTTDHKSQIEALREKPMSRVALDKYVDGTQCIILNRMQAQDPAEIFISMIHGAILAWRRDCGAKTTDGRERLLDDAFNEMVQYVGLMKVQPQKPVYDKDGKPVLTADGKVKMANIPDSTRRVWFGANAGLRTIANTFAAQAPPVPTAYIGTEAKTGIASMLLPLTIETPNGKLGGFMRRYNSYTSAEEKIKKGDEKTNIVLDAFERDTANPYLTFDVKNKGYKTLAALCAARTAVRFERSELPASPAEPVVEQPVVVETKKQKRAA